MQVLHVIVHQPEQVREIVTEAARIADEQEYGPRRWGIVFAHACELLGARVTVIPQEPTPFGPLPTLHGIKGGL